jgi:hypothetical protein
VVPTAPARDQQQGLASARVGEVGGLPSVLRAWAPLAASWLLMACELPALSAVVARMTNPEVELAAYGGVILPIALVIEAPIIMLLSASTALSRDRASHRALRRFAHRSGLALTILHLLIALTPLYDVVVGGWIGAPAPVLDAARVGLVIMTPWTWAIAYRRFNQGVMIRFGHNRAVTVGTMLRLGTNLAILAVGLTLYWSGSSIPGAVLASIAVASGVTVEAIYSGLRVRSIVREHLEVTDPTLVPLRGVAFSNFYVPLALTSIVTLLAQPLASAGVTRMPDALHSLATVPVVVGLLFMFQAMGLALTEVVVAGLGSQHGARSLWRFSVMLSVGVGVLVSGIAVSPISQLWFAAVSGLAPELVELARGALLLGIPIPIMRALQSWYSGVLVHAHRTRAISEAVGVFLVSAGLVIWMGVVTQEFAGIHVAIAAYSVGRVCQTVWLWWRSREQVAALGMQ